MKVEIALFYCELFEKVARGDAAHREI